MMPLINASYTLLLLLFYIIIRIFMFFVSCVKKCISWVFPTRTTRYYNIHCRTRPIKIQTIIVVIIIYYGNEMNVFCCCWKVKPLIYIHEGILETFNNILIYSLFNFKFLLHSRHVFFFYTLLFYCIHIHDYYYFSRNKGLYTQIIIFLFMVTGFIIVIIIIIIMIIINTSFKLHRH